MNTDCMLKSVELGWLDPGLWYDTLKIAVAGTNMLLSDHSPEDLSHDMTVKHTGSTGKCKYF